MTSVPGVRLTSLSACAGCASKIGAAELARVLRGVPSTSNEHVLVGYGTVDDAAVYQLRDDLAIVQTVDFFPPIVDDPYDFGRIAAANAVSDIYAMGGVPISALNIVGFPLEKLGPAILSRILAGGADIAREAGFAILGGHTIEDDEPKFGMAVTGTIDPRRIVTNAAARPGDVLVLEARRHGHPGVGPQERRAFRKGTGDGGALDDEAQRRRIARDARRERARRHRRDRFRHPRTRRRDDACLGRAI